MSAAGFAAAVAAAVFNGSFAAFAKLPAVRRSGIDPVFFNGLCCAGVALSSCAAVAWLRVEGAAVELSAYGALAGSLFVFAGLFSFVAVPLVGLGVAQGVWGGSAIFVSFAWGTLGPAALRAPLVSLPLSVVALLLLSAGVVGIALNGAIAASLSSPQRAESLLDDAQGEEHDGDVHSSHAHGRPDHAPSERTSGMRAQQGQAEQQRHGWDEPPSQPCANSLDDAPARETAAAPRCGASATSRLATAGGTSRLATAGGTVALRSALAHADDAGRPSDGTAEAGAHAAWHRRAAGTASALLVGLFGGSVLVPSKFAPPEVSGFALLPSFGLGALCASTLVCVAYAVACRCRGEPVLLGGRAALAAGLASGVVWNAGNACAIYAMGDGGLNYGVAYPLVQCALLVSGLLGICAFGEIREPLAIGIFFTAAVVLLSLIHI